MQNGQNHAVCNQHNEDTTPTDRITRFATGPTQFNNLHTPVSVLDGRTRSSSVGQWSRPPQTVYTHAYTPLQPRRSDSNANARARLATVSHAQGPPTATPGCVTSPTSPATERRCAPMQTLTNSVLQTGPLQVFMFKQTNVTVLTRPPPAQPKHNSPAKKPSFKKTPDVPVPHYSYQSPEKTAVGNTQATLKRLPSETGGLSAVVQNLLRRISPSAADRKARQRRQTTAIVLPCHDQTSDEPTPTPTQHRPFSVNSRQSNHHAPTPLAPVQNGLPTDDLQLQLQLQPQYPYPIPTNMNTAPCTRRLVKSNFVYSGSLDDNDAKLHSNSDAAKVRDARVLSFTASASASGGPQGSKPTMSILERFLKGRTVPANSDAQRPPAAASTETSFNASQPDRPSATSTPKSRGMHSSSRSSRGVLSSAATPSCTNSVTSDRLSSEVSSGAIADVDESAADESDIFGAASPSALNVNTIYCFPVGPAASRRTTRLPHQLSTCADTTEVPVASECSSENELKERKLLANRYRSPLRHRGTLPSEPLPELNEREPRAALTSPETVKSIKLSLAAFGYGQQPYCAHRTLKSLNDLRAPTLSPLRSPSNSVTTQSPAKCNRLAIAILRNNSKHDSLRKPLCSSSKSAGKLKIRRTSSA